MRPSNQIIKGGQGSVSLNAKRSNTDSARTGSMTIRCLAEPGRQYAIYLRGGSGASLKIDLAPGAYEAKWIDTKTGGVAKSQRIEGNPDTLLAGPEYQEDIALAIKRVP
jgi:hypothetical protein